MFLCFIIALNINIFIFTHFTGSDSSKSSADENCADRYQTQIQLNLGGPENNKLYIYDIYNRMAELNVYEDQNYFEKYDN